MNNNESNDHQSNDSRSNNNRLSQYDNVTIDTRASSNDAKENEARISSLNAKVKKSCMSSDNESRLSSNDIGLNKVANKDAHIDGLQAETPLTSTNDPVVGAAQTSKIVGDLGGGGYRGTA